MLYPRPASDSIEDRLTVLERLGRIVWGGAMAIVAVTAWFVTGQVQQMHDRERLNRLESAVEKMAETQHQLATSQAVLAALVAERKEAK